MGLLNFGGGSGLFPHPRWNPRLGLSKKNLKRTWPLLRKNQCAERLETIESWSCFAPWWVGTSGEWKRTSWWFQIGFYEKTLLGEMLPNLKKPIISNFFWKPTVPREGGWHFLRMCLFGDMFVVSRFQKGRYNLQGTNTSHMGRRRIIFKHALGEAYVSSQESISTVLHVPSGKLT